MKTRHHILAIAAVFIAATTAHAAKLADIKPILIPTGLDFRDARAAMVQTIAQKDIPTAQQDGPTNAWQGIVDELLRARVWGYQSQFRDTASRNLRSWFIESVEKDAVVFGCKVRRHYMSVRMAVAEGKITPQVVAPRKTSTNRKPASTTTRSCGSQTSRPKSAKPSASSPP